MSSTTISAGLFSAIGIYLIFSNLLHMPTLAATQAALKLTQSGKAHGFQAIRLRIADGISRHIHLDEYKRRELTATLKYAEIEQTPESYIAGIIVKGFFRLIWAIPGAFISPILVPVIVMLTINKIMDETKRPRKMVTEKRSSIERELPRFVATIAQEISASRDVLSLLETYRTSAGPVWRNELDITIADMRSGSQEQALNRLSGRVGSGMLSEVVRGLLGVLRGDDGTITFALLDHDYQKLEVQQLQKEALKRPGKLKKYVVLLLICIFAILGYPMVKDLMSNMGTLLG